MDLLHKKCEVCGTNISKIKNNLYRLLFLYSIKCPNCKREYTLPGWLGMIFSIPTGANGLIILLFLTIVIITLIIDIDYIMGIKLNTFIVFTYSYILSLILTFLIMLVVPLKLFKTRKDKENKK